MAKKFLMGNEAIALAAIDAGVGFVSGYPGTPSTEVLETVAKNNDGSVYVEWSVNEKSAMEIAAGAAYAGVRCMVTMKQVGLNVASDPLMSLAYIGVKGGMIILVADDPGPISSQTEQDTRTFGYYSKLPVFDPQSPEEAYDMVFAAYECSEKYHTPVILRPTTRVCHGCAAIETRDEKLPVAQGHFEKSPNWVIFPRLSYQSHINIEKRNPIIGEELSQSKYNYIKGSGRIGVAAGGISCAYAEEAIDMLSLECRFLKIGTPHPFPEKLAVEFLKSVDKVLVTEELDPVIERQLIFLCGKYHLSAEIYGKLSGNMPTAGENSSASIKAALAAFVGIELPKQESAKTPEMPVRPPVLCAGCPHRASFYAVKRAMAGRKAAFSGDIGCYTLGNAMPLDMVDTCLCMGAGVTIAQGLHEVEKDCTNFAFIGDSTFFHTGIPGVINAVYNEHNTVIIVLDNSTTAMTGHQPHPGTGKTMMGNIAEKISIFETLKGLGVKHIERANPLELDNAIAAVKRAAQFDSVSAVIFEAPCIAITKPQPQSVVAADKCIGCKKCINQLGCPAIVFNDGKAEIEASLCYGCTLCNQVCPVGAIEVKV